VVVVQVESGSPAADANIRPGDLILEVNGVVIATVKEYREAVAKVKKDTVARFLVKRAGRTLYLTLETEIISHIREPAPTRKEGRGHRPSFSC
jgi:serine protease Do